MYHDIALAHDTARHCSICIFSRLGIADRESKCGTESVPKKVMSSKILINYTCYFLQISSTAIGWKCANCGTSVCETRVPLSELNDDGSDSRAFTQFRSLPCHSPIGIRKTLTSSLIFYTFSHLLCLRGLPNFII